MKPKSWWYAIMPGLVSSPITIMASLKSNNRPFGLLSDEEKEVMRECGVDFFDGDGWVKIQHHAGRLGKSNTYRVCADFEPVYEEPKSQLDPNEAPEGYVAELYKGNCSSCAFYYCGGTHQAKEKGHTCDPLNRRDNCHVIFLKKPQSEWGEWQEYELQHKDGFTGRIRFKKE